jgi:hypothetical protein
MIGFISTSITPTLFITINTVLSLIYTVYSSLHTNLLSLFPIVFTIRFLATDLNTALALQITMKSSCYFFFNHSVLLCPNLYSINLHNSLRTRSILILVLLTAEPSWTLLSCKRTRVIQLWHAHRRKHSSIATKCRPHRKEVT